MKNFLRKILLAKKDLVGAPDGFSFEIGSKKEIIDSLYHLVKKKGFVEVSTPVFDFFEVYEKVLGSSTKELFVFKDKDDFIVPRYDITTQIVRFLAPRIKTLNLPVKLFYWGEVFREPEFGWHPRQIRQFGLEIVGGNEKETEELLETLKETIEILTKFKLFSNYRLVFNFSQILDSVLSEFPEEDREVAKYLISNKDLPSLKTIISEPTISLLEELIWLSFENVEVVEKRIFEIFRHIPREEINANISMVERLFSYVIFDPLLVPTMDYYSGIFFKVFVDTLPYSIARGGRYDKLTKKFGYGETAMGFAVDIV